MAVKRIYLADRQSAQHYLRAQLAAEKFVLTRHQWKIQTRALLVGGCVVRENLCSNFPDSVPDRVLH